MRATRQARPACSSVCSYGVVPRWLSYTSVSFRARFPITSRGTAKTYSPVARSLVPTSPGSVVRTSRSGPPKSRNAHTSNESVPSTSEETGDGISSKCCSATGSESVAATASESRTVSDKGAEAGPKRTWLSGKRPRAGRPRHIARPRRFCRRRRRRWSDSRLARSRDSHARARPRNGRLAAVCARTLGESSARVRRSRQHRRTRRETQRSRRPSPTTRRRACPSARSARSPRGEGPHSGPAALPAPRASVYAWSLETEGPHPD